MVIFKFVLFVLINGFIMWDGIIWWSFILISVKILIWMFVVNVEIYSIIGIKVKKIVKVIIVRLIIIKNNMLFIFIN